MADLTREQLKQRLADTLSKTPGSLSEKWDTVIDDALASARLTVTTALLTRGYTPAQAAAWDRFAEFVADLGLFWALVRGGAAGDSSDYGGRFLDRLDRRKELETVGVTVNGVFIPVGAGSPAGGAVIVGRLDESNLTLGGMPIGPNGEMFGERPRGGFGSRPFGEW